MKLFFILLFIISSIIYGQEFKHTNFLNLEYEKIGQQSLIRTGYRIVFDEFKEYPLNFSAMSIDLGFGVNRNFLLIAPTLTYDFFGIFYFVGLRSTYYITNKNQTFILAPEIGITYFSMWKFGYSYNINLTNKNATNNFSNHSYFITLSYPFFNNRKN